MSNWASGAFNETVPIAPKQPGGVKAVRPNEPIIIKPSHRGLLHKHLGLNPNDPVPLDMLHKAAANQNPDIRREAQFALNFHGLGK